MRVCEAELIFVPTITTRGPQSAQNGVRRGENGKLPILKKVSQWMTLFPYRKSVMSQFPKQRHALMMACTGRQSDAAHVAGCGFHLSSLSSCSAI